MCAASKHVPGQHGLCKPTPLHVRRVENWFSPSKRWACLVRQTQGRSKCRFQSIQHRYCLKIISDQVDKWKNKATWKHAEFTWKRYMHGERSRLSAVVPVWRNHEHDEWPWLLQVMRWKTDFLELRDSRISYRWVQGRYYLWQKVSISQQRREHHRKLFNRPKSVPIRWVQHDV